MSRIGILLGAKAQLLMGQTEAGQVEFTGVIAGADNITDGIEVTTRPSRGGRGRAGEQATRYVRHDFGVMCDSNPVHDPVVRDGNRKRFWFTWREHGEGSGRPQARGQGVAVVNFGGDHETDGTDWQIAIMVDGDVDYTPQA